MADKIYNLRSSSTGDFAVCAGAILRDFVAVLGPQCTVPMTVIMNGGTPVQIITGDFRK